MRSCVKGLRDLHFLRKVCFFTALNSAIWFSSAAWAVQPLATQSVTVAWNAGTDPGIAGYVLYYGTTNGNYSTNINVGTNTSAVVSGLISGQTNYFAVAAYNVANLQGSQSTALPYIVPGSLEMSSSSPANTITFPVSPGHWYAVLASTNLITWTNIWQTPTESSNVWVTYQDTQASSYSQRYYRLVLH
jgi:hypothetical protein